MYKYSKMLYNKKNLREYCLENKYDYDSILSRLKYIFYTNKFSKLTTKAKIELAIERYKNRDNYKYANYIYEGEKLRDYCDHKNISRKFIYSRLRYYDKSVNKKNLPMIIKIQLAINSYNNPKNFKYSNITYKNKNLLEYCKENTIRFEAIRYRIYYARNYGKLDIILFMSNF